MGTVWKILTRKKVFDSSALQKSPLSRELTTFDLTALGVGSTLGIGVYVIVGHVARDTAGPSVVLSFLIAAIASIFAGLCYAEFGARTPRAGSAYIYSYTCVGEFVAFIIGWNLILEYVIGSASVAKGISVYIDALANDTLKNTFADIAPINVKYMAEYFDFFSFSIAVLLSAGLAFGMKKSSIMNNIFTGVNILVVLFVVIGGSIEADPNNWRLEANETAGAGYGGFFPFGVEGMIKGAATCFYAFIGFDCIATTGEEVGNPRKAIPIAIVVSLLICFLSYFSTATVVTMMLPFYEQDVNAPLPHAFAEVGWIWAKWIIAIGGLFGLFASLFGAMFPLPRILYAMASDGLIFRFLGIVNGRFASPIVGTLLAGLLTGLMSALFDLSQLVNMMSIGTLLAYTIVAVCVLLLRYEANEEMEYTLLLLTDSDSDNESYTDSPRFDASVEDVHNDAKNGNKSNKISKTGILKYIFGRSNQKKPTKFTERLAAIYITIYFVLALIFSLFFLFIYNDLFEGKTYAIVLTSVVGFLMIIILMLLALQPTTTKQLYFKVPLVPLIPALSILINIYLMLMLDSQTWIRFGVWMLVGVPMYIFLRLCCHSKQSSSEKFIKTEQNGEIMQNGNLPTPANDVRSNGNINNAYVNEEPSAPLEDPSDSGFESNFALDADLNAVEEHPTEIQSKKSISSVDVALAELDNVLLHEETTQTASIDPPERKLSIDTVSNASCLPVEEKVVALVHREDIISEPTTPLNGPFFLSTVSLKQTPTVVEENTENEVVDEKKEHDLPREETSQNSEKSETIVPKLLDQEITKNIDENNLTKESDNYESSTENPPESKESKLKSNELVIKKHPSSSDDSPPVSLEDLNSERNESDTDVFEEPLVMIPVPPSLENFEAFKAVQIPRASLEKKVGSPSKTSEHIRSKPSLTELIQPTETKPMSSTSSSSIDESTDDNVKFGGERYTALTAKLEEMLKSNHVQQKLTKPVQRELELPKQSETLKPVMSQIIGEIVRNSTIEDKSGELATAVDNEKVDYKSQKPSDIRAKLENIFRQPTRVVKKPATPLVAASTNINQNESESEVEKVQRILTDTDKTLVNNDKDLHKEQMNDIFKTIRLRKVDNLKEN